jgi:hypothetical protein
MSDLLSLRRRGRAGSAPAGPPRIGKPPGDRATANATASYLINPESGQRPNKPPQKNLANVEKIS